MIAGKASGDSTLTQGGESWASSLAVSQKPKSGPQGARLTAAGHHLEDRQPESQCCPGSLLWHQLA